MATKRPGQGKSKSRNRGASHWFSNQKLADEHYDSISGGTDDAAPVADLNSLIQAASKVQKARKDNQQKKKTQVKKQLLSVKEQLDKELETEFRKQQLQDAEAEVDKEDQADEETGLAAQKARIDRKLAQTRAQKEAMDAAAVFASKLALLRQRVEMKAEHPELISGTDIFVLRTVYRQTEEAFARLTRDQQKLIQDPSIGKEKGGNARKLLDILKAQIDGLALVAIRNDAQIKQEQQATKQQGRGNSLMNTLEQFLSRGKGIGSSMSRGMRTAASMFGRGAKGTQAWAGNKIDQAGAVLKSIGAQFGSDNKVVMAIRYVGSGIKALGSKVTDLGSQTQEWLKKNLSSVFSYLHRKWSQLQSIGKSGLGALGSLIGIGALVKSLLIPVLDGVNTALEQRYGKNYVQSFISDMWTKSKTWLVDKLKDFLFGVKEEAPGAPGSLEAKRQEIRGSLVPQSQEIRLDLLAPTAASGWKPDSQQRLISSTLMEYGAVTDPTRKAQIGRFLQFYLNRGNGITIKNLDPEVYNGLKSAGFDVKNFTPGKVPETPWTFKGQMSSTMKDLKTAFPKVFGSPGFNEPKSAISFSRNPIFASPPPMKGSEPAAPASGGGSGTSPGLGNVHIPKTSVSDAFHLWNGGVMIGAGG